MPLEAATWLDDLVSTNPIAGDNVSQGDDHLRLLKAVLKAQFPSLLRAIYLEQASVDLASATTPDLSTPATNYINITGTTQIDGFATEPAGFTRLVRFAGILTLNYNGTSLILLTGDDIVTAAGDHAIFTSLGSGNWRMVAYFRQNGKPLADVFPVPQPVAGDAGFVLQASGAGAYAWAKKRDAGIVHGWASETVPSWALECNGATISRTTYADLFTAIGTRFGVGNGTTTFSIPDFRGEFLRGWDHGAGRDPDAAFRTDAGGGDTGDHVGTKQGDAFELHGHPNRIANSSGAGNDTTGGMMLDNNNPVNHPAFTGTPTNTQGQLIGGEGGSETRPRNNNVMYIITI